MLVNRRPGALSLWLRQYRVNVSILTVFVVGVLWMADLGADFIEPSYSLLDLATALSGNSTTLEEFLESLSVEDTKKLTQESRFLIFREQHGGWETQENVELTSKNYKAVHGHSQRMLKSIIQLDDQKATYCVLNMAFESSSLGPSTLDWIELHPAVQVLSLPAVQQQPNATDPSKWAAIDQLTSLFLATQLSTENDKRLRVSLPPSLSTLLEAPDVFRPEVDILFLKGHHSRNATVCAWKPLAETALNPLLYHFPRVVISGDMWIDTKDCADFLVSFAITSGRHLYVLPDHSWLMIHQEDPRFQSFEDLKKLSPMMKSRD